jgi:hypothetical protein
MAKLKERVIEEIELLPDDVLEPILGFVEYLKAQRSRAQGLNAKYGSIEQLRSKVMKDDHSWEEERDLFEWEAALTEVDTMRKTLKSGDA